MLFKRLLASRRKRASFPTDQDALLNIVRTADDTARRRDACRLIQRLPALRELGTDDVDAGVREIAQARYRKLLCGLDDVLPALDERMEEIRGPLDQRGLEQVASNGREPEVRLAAISRVSSPSVLAACALGDATTANRCAATERLQDKRALEHVARSIGKKDKNVYRIARRKLREIAEQEALPQRLRAQCEEICGKLERLGRFENWVQDRALLDLLDREWADIESKAEDEWRARYLAERQRFLSDYDAYQREHQALLVKEESLAAVRGERERLIDELAACAALSDEVRISAEMERIAAHWSELESLPEKEQAAMDRKYRAAGSEAGDRLERLKAVREADRRLRELVASAEHALAQTKPLERKRVRKLMEDAKPLLETPGVDGEAARSMALAREKLDDRLRKQTHHAEQRMEQAGSKLNELEGHVEAGELKQAEPLYQSLSATLDLLEASGLPRKQYAPVAERLHRLAPRLRDLQKWRKWGADTHRDELCRAMEELESAQIPLEAKSLRLHDLQMEWKGLDKGGSPVNHPLWNRFHAASEKVYESCKPYLKQQAEAREAARGEREALCAQLEGFLDQVDWERMDWKKAVRAEREMRQAWAAMGEVEGRHRRQLEKRFRGAMKRLDEKLTAERERNQQLKRDLIAKVEALADEPDLHKAIDATKRYQREWTTTVSARQKEENKLWQNFRAACDAVFERRRQQHEAQMSELAENLKSAEAICEETEALAASSTDPEALLSALRTFEARWRDHEGLPLPRQASGPLNQRWRRAQAHAQQRHRELLQEQRRSSLDLLAGQAAVCERLEQALESGSLDDALISTAESDWQALKLQSDPRLQEAIEARFSEAISAAKAGHGIETSVFDANRKRRADLCLHLEILARVDSPPELTQERMAFQVSRLKDRMRKGEKDPLGGAAGLLEEWYLCGPAPAAETAALNERFRRARCVLEKAPGETEAA
jgi:hypothetical protein